MTPEEIAQSLGVIYDGTWTGFKNSPTMYEFSDPQTGGTFLVTDPERAAERLKQMRKEFGMKDNCPIKKFTEQDLQKAADGLEINSADFPGLLEGMNAELEHCDFTEGDPTLSARIALAHLRERPDYYKKLKEAGL